MNEKEAEQAALAAHDVPSFTSEECNSKVTRLADQLKRLSRRPRKKKPKKMEGEENTGTGDESTAADGEPATAEGAVEEDGETYDGGSQEADVTEENGKDSQTVKSQGNTIEIEIPQAREEKSGDIDIETENIM